MFDHTPVPAAHGVLLVAVLALGACDDGPRDGSGAASVVARDSAGIRIVEYPGEVPPERVTVRQGEPDLVIGREGDPDYELFGVTSVVGLSDGTVVVANSGADELRVYDPAGEYVRTVGRAGEGPGEFSFPSRLEVRPSDTVIVTDPPARRLTYLAPDGTPARFESWVEDAQKLDRPSGDACFSPGLEGTLSTGERLLRGYGCITFTGSEGFIDMIAPLVLIDGDDVRTVGSYLQGQTYEVEPTDESPLPMVVPPLTGGARAAVVGETFVVTDARRHVIRVRDGQGRLLEVIREGRPVAPITERDRELHRAERARAGDTLDDRVPFPEHFPPYRQVLATPGGDLWLDGGTLPGDSLQSWRVVPADRGPMRLVRLPGDVRVRSVRDGRVYGVRTGELGIQQVVVYDVGGGS